ncbi:MAG: DUF423 domain-containing protein [Sulfuritalea sp.]|nr:DUF423 domain-containing protein [Sulfuritalea sp.]
MKTTYRIVWVLASLAGALSVLAAAYVAHVPGLEAAALRSLHSALQMLQFHTLALLLVAWIAPRDRFTWPLLVSALAFVAGMAMFSVNILLNQLFGIGLFKPLAPYGGMAFVMGWLTLGLSFGQKDSAK